MRAFVKYTGVGLVSLALCLLISLPSPAQVRVRGYFRKDGTYVAPHYRSRPDGNFYNNWSTKGNINPYTGGPGTKVTAPSRSSGDVFVEGYFRGDGTYVAPHHRSRPDGNFYDNWSTKGNVNPYSGDEGTRVSPPAEKPSYLVPSPANTFKYQETLTQLRMGAATPLQGKGFNVNWQEYTLLDLWDMESRIDVAERLRGKGLNVDWRVHSLTNLIDIECRADIAERLRSRGLQVDWRSHSLSDLMDIECRMDAAQRLKARGVNVDWRKQTLSQLISIELSLK